jgi:hypothetical protein
MAKKRKLKPVPPGTISTQDAVPMEFKGGPCDRLTVILDIKHEHCGDDAMEAGAKFAFPLTDIQQPYYRRFPVSQEWSKLDLGWYKGDSAGLILIKNRSLHQDPDVLKTMVLEIKFEEAAEWDCFEILPDRCFLAESRKADRLVIRGRAEKTSMTINVFPSK